MNSASTPVLCQLERLTRPFRETRARENEHKAAEARRLYYGKRDELLEVLTDLPKKHARGDAWEPPPPQISVRGVRMRASDWLSAQCNSAITTEKWHAQRATGQRFRFKNLESCGVRMRTTMCGMCGNETTRKAVPDGCGIARLCATCSLNKAKSRRARFGRARGRCIVNSPKKVHRKKRRGGAYSERMLTVTIPHFTRDEMVSRVEELEAIAGDYEECPSMRKRCARTAEAARKLLSKCPTTIHARVQTAWDAWPIFVRKLTQHWKENGETLDGTPRSPLIPKLHRAAEWTLGHDGQGHPHFHVWVWSPFLDLAVVKAMWTESLFAVGLPPCSIRTEDKRAVVNLKQIYKFDNAMAAELLKGGRREALELSRLRFVDGPSRGGEDVFSYSEGWTIKEVLDVAVPETVAALYEVLEGKRLTQASRGFFEEEPVKICPWCYAGRDLKHCGGSALFKVTFGAPKDEPPIEVCIHDLHCDHDELDFSDDFATGPP